VTTLRRFATALRTAHWGQVLVELTLLVLGILIALAVNSWIEDRRDARLEHQYLELLARDLDRDLGALDEALQFEQSQVEAAAFAYRALRESSVVPSQREAVALALGQLTSRRTLRLGRATYTDLLSTGNLRLMRNAALRDRIVRLYENNERAQLIRDRNNQEFVDRMYMTYLLDHAYVAPRATRNLQSVSAADSAFAKRAARPEKPVTTADDRLWQMPPSAPDWNILAGRVWYRGIVAQGAIDQYRQIADDIRAVRSEIAAELS
jgi:Family of unknown function (DUF6090)